MSRLALASLSLLGYTYVGYPALVAALARTFGGEHPKDTGFEPRVSVLIPVYNAKGYVRRKLESLVQQDYPKDKIEILVYSDASTDGSDEEVLAFADRGVTLVRGDKRLGKPTALNTLRPRATGEILVLTDIRQPLSPNAIRDLVGHFADPSVGCVSGNLELVGGTGAGFYWKYENFIRKQEARFRGMVGVTGPLYAIRAGDLGDVPTDVILDDMFIPLRLRLRGKKLLLEESAVALDDAFEDDREKGRKVRTLAGNFQLFEKLPGLLSPTKNPIFLETFSHKLLRLAGPALLGGLAVGTIHGALFGPTFLSRTAMRALLAGEIGFTVLALLGPKAGAPGKLARTFVVLNTAAVEGFVRYIRGRQEVTW
ncbi:MAG: glycosyltransferase family 2 protein [Polyangiaceae bacterium]|nr:glycosyltransferase family 2 protein [Polyangiaceae bacterium]